MKEYKLVALKLGLRNRGQKFEDLLNQHAGEGWRFVSIPNGWTSMILEREKNR